MKLINHNKSTSVELSHDAEIHVTRDGWHILQHDDKCFVQQHSAVSNISRVQILRLVVSNRGGYISLSDSIQVLKGWSLWIDPRKDDTLVAEQED